MADDIAALSADILSWCEPMVRDRLFVFWSKSAMTPEAGRNLAELQWRTWRGALGGLPHLASLSRRDLTRELHQRNLSPGMIEQGDGVVVEEIADVVLLRFRRSPQLAKGYMKALVLAAAQLIAAPQPSGREVATTNVQAA